MTILDPTIIVPELSPAIEPTLRFSITFDRDCRILESASSTEGRYAFHGVLLELTTTNGRHVPGDPVNVSLDDPPIEARLVATDGRVLTVLLVDIDTTEVLGIAPTGDSLEGRPVTIERPIDPIMLDRQYILPPEIVKAALVKTRSNGLPARITIDGTNETDSGPLLETVHPDLGTITGRTIVGNFPKWQAVMPVGREVDRRFAFNPTLLLALAKSLGSPDSVVFETSADPGATILVRGSVRSLDRTGVLMPITLDA